MRIALLGDIHANLEALEAVLADAALQGCTDYACLGDLVGFGADPAACVDRIQGLECAIVAGDFDKEAGSGCSLAGMNPTAAEHYRWMREELGEQRMLWLKCLELVHHAPEFSMVHSSLDSPTFFYYVSHLSDARSSFANQTAAICFHGHTHVPRVFVKEGHSIQELSPDIVRIEQGFQYFINVGSVGQPRDGDWRACYVIYDVPECIVKFRRIGYDLGTTQGKILGAGLPPMLAERLADGF